MNRCTLYKNADSVFLRIFWQELVERMDGIVIGSKKAATLIVRA